MEKSTVLWNRQLGSSYCRMGLTSSSDYENARPGQFVMVQTTDQMVPLLRRPFSIHRQIFEQGTFRGIELLYKVVGKGTRQLSRLGPGDALDLLGPLGRGFRIPGEFQSLFIVGGGIGVAPLVFLAQRLHREGRSERCTAFVGGRSCNDLLCRTDFQELGMTVHVTTDDGSEGERCQVTHPLEAALNASPPDMICSCGPPAMLECVAGIARKHGVPCQVSVETLMACGLGACLGCAVESRENGGRYLHVCMDGPVFDIENLKI